MKKIVLSLLFVSVIVFLFATEWTEVSPPEGYIGTLSYHFISSNEGWAFSTDHRHTQLYHTINTGQNWELIYESDRYAMEGLQMIDSENGWTIFHASRQPSYLFTTINGGRDWFRTDMQLPNIVRKIAGINFSDTQNGLIAGVSNNESYLYRTTNGCYEFELLFHFNQGYTLSNIDCIGEENIWVSGGIFNGIAIHSNNGGVDWEFLGDSIEVSIVRSSQFLTDQVYGFTGSFRIDGEFLENVLILTNDKMDTYAVHGRDTFEERIYSCYLMDEQTIWVGGFRHMFLTTNGGRSFSVFQNFNTSIKDISFIDSTGFATGSNGSLYVYSPTVNNEELTVSKPNLKLDNYPNPFNPETTISFSNPQAGKVNLSIYNLKGQLVKELLDDEVTKGAHSVVWNGKDGSGKSVASGIYFTKIKTEAGIKTKKMLMMK